MKYTYAYKTSDGVRHEDSLEAESRDEVFAALRKRGIKPIKVVAADGSKANGEIRGVRKRVVTTIAIGAALIAGALAFFAGERNQLADDALSPVAPRHQIYGDPALLEAFEHGEFDEVISRDGDKMLAWFAQPGKLMCPKGLTVGSMRMLTDGHIAALQAVLSEDIALNQSDSREITELKQIVNGMRAELNAYLANGNGTIQSYWRRLLERFHQENQIFERTRRELEKEEDSAVWDEKNDALRRLGLRTIVRPTPES